MQFLASTWASYGVDADGDGRADRWDPADAIYSAANYLRASGAPSDYRRAIFAYNHASGTSARSRTGRRRYRGPSDADGRRGAPAKRSGRREAPEGADLRLAGETPTPVRFIPGERAELAPGDGHVALVPAGVPATVQAMLVAGNELQDLPYGPRGHPDPLGASEEDCSSTVNYVLYRAGVRPLAEILSENPLAQDYVDWGDPGPGRWVTIYASATPDAARVHRRSPASASTPATTAPTSAPTATKTARAGGSSTTSRRGRTGRCATRRGCKVASHGRPQGRLPADRRRPRVGQLRALAARGRRRGRGAARRPRARPAVQPPRVLQGLPARRRDPRGAVVPPRPSGGGSRTSSC